MDFPVTTLLTIAHNVSNTGSANTINGATITIAVQVFAIPKIDITAKQNPMKLEPVSPINVLAGLKLNGKNPISAPASAVTRSIAIIGEQFSENIISSDKHEITPIPEDKPVQPIY